MNSYQWHNPRSSQGKKSLYQVDSTTSLVAQVEALTTRLNKLSKAQVNTVTTDFNNSQDGQTPPLEVEQVDFVNANRQQNNPYGNTYNPGWRNHRNFSWRDGVNAQPPGFGQQQRPPQNFQQRYQGQYQGSKPNGPPLEELLAKFITESESRYKQYDEKIRMQEADLNTQKASLQTIETQVGQMAKSLSERPQGKLPSNTETNPKENVSAITLRNNKVYPEPPYPSLTPNLNSDPPPMDDRRIPGVGARQDQ